MKIVNFGSLNVDYVYRVDRFLLPGETRPAKTREVHAGGKGLNQSIALARAGAMVYHAGMTGSDGALLLETLRQAGVNTEHLAKSDMAGGHTVIQVTDDGENSILLYGGTNRALAREYIDGVLSRFSDGDIVLLQNEINLADYIIEQAHGLGLRVAFNAAPIDDGVLSYPLEKTSWLIVNELEGAALAQTENTGDILPELARRYPETAVLLTLGAEGCRYMKGGELVSRPAQRAARVVDTTGAGDTFTGYFLQSVTCGLSVGDALDRAGMAAALAIQKNGAAASIPNAAEVDGALKLL